MRVSFRSNDGVNEKSGGNYGARVLPENTAADHRRSQGTNGAGSPRMNIGRASIDNVRHMSHIFPDCVS